MATLEKIRSKSVLLLVIIGAALIAFIIGDFFTSGRAIFGTGTTLAKVDGQKIDIMDYQKRLENANQQMQQSGRKIDDAVLRQQVLDQLVNETLFNQEIDKLGLTVTNKELTDAVFGPMVDQMVRQQYGVNSAAEFADMAVNPTKYEIPAEQARQIKEMWTALQTQVKESLLQQKFQALFNGVLVANDLDAKRLYDEAVNVNEIVFAKKDLSSIADSEVGEVTDAEIADRYGKEKKRYHIDEEMRLVSYINLPLNPSADDRVAAQKRVDEALVALNTLPGTSGLADMTDFVVSAQRQPVSRVSDNRVKEFLGSASDSAVKVISNMGDKYTIAKINSRRNDVDSVCIDFIMMQAPKGERDSIMRSLNSGAIAYADVEKNDNAQGQEAMWVSLVAPETQQVRDAILTAPQGVWFTPDTANAEAGRLFRVTERKAPVTVYDYAVITYDVTPSNATKNRMVADLNKYIASHRNAKAFSDSAQAAGYMVQHANVTASTPQLGGLNASRGAVAWAMKAKKGEVSEVLGGDESGRYIVVAVDDIYKGDYAPATDPQIREILSREIINDKKAAKLLGEYSGKAKDVAGYAQLMSTSADTTSVAFDQYMIPKIGAGEGKIAAAVMAAPKGKLVGPMQGGKSVIVFEVVNTNNDGRPYDYNENAAKYLRARGASALGQQMQRILRGNKKVENNILKFYNDNN